MNPDNSIEVKSDWTLYTQSDKAWAAMLEACAAAKKSIDLEQFIFVPDEVGQKFIDICAQKAKEGVKVRFLWDSAGSWSLFGTFLADDIRRKGIDIAFFNTLLPRTFDMLKYRFWFFRNHRRSLIVDGEVAFTGSICLSDRMRQWRETHMRITGEVVIEISVAFERLWERANYRRREFTSEFISNINNRVLWRGKIIGRDLISKDGINYVTNSPQPRRRFVYYRIVEAIRGAHKYIYITTPYFAPTRKLMRVLLLAAHRGVDVRIILPSGSDYRIVDLCGRSFFTTMLKAGVKIYLYKGKKNPNENPRMIHNKTIAIDGDWATVGTLNLDTISLLYNYEGNIVTTRSEIVDELRHHFENDMAESEQITLDSWLKRSVFHKILEFLARLLRKLL